jgi:RNA polymerase sigma-32 factor
MAYQDDQNTQKSNSTYIRHAMAEPLLERDHEQDLARRWRDKQDERALHELVRSYTRLVVASAHKFKHYGLPIADLIQEGNIGLMHAANRFEADRDIRFSTYAAWWIRSQMQDYILRNWSIVRTGTTSAQKSLFFNLRRLRSKISGAASDYGLTDHGRVEIAKALGVKAKEVEIMEARMNGDQSLNIVVGIDSEDEYGAFLADDRPNPEDIVIGMKDSQARSKWLAESLGQLSEREQKIIRERHLKFESVTLEDLGKQLGISKERVRQLESRAMEKLKDSLVASHKTPSDFYAQVA